ncbi:hypothetical protein BC834DRAFT_875407 [Gloeopeniophorella convolvens]|nr:hypothetical protein BC834DRAFT_875407 [Gloeopeniophorella convolvens]
MHNTVTNHLPEPIERSVRATPGRSLNTPYTATAGTRPGLCSRGGEETAPAGLCTYTRSDPRRGRIRCSSEYRRLPIQLLGSCACLGYWT